ncbi:MAG: DUF2281 domain-containing protein [Planctomycetaceae bacterium]|nr:DUF2281 domain-containing protein [Planctomycetaceae bacterium]
MQTLQIGIIQPQAINLLRELDSLKLITIMQPDICTEIPSEERESVTVNSKRPVFGCAKGQFWMSDDFDAPLEEMSAL